MIGRDPYHGPGQAYGYTTGLTQTFLIVFTPLPALRVSVFVSCTVFQRP
jgi:hypothetical protein